MGKPGRIELKFQLRKVCCMLQTNPIIMKMSGEKENINFLEFLK